MMRTLKLIKSDYGGVEHYVKSVCGLTDKDIQKIRTRLLVEERLETGWIWGHVSRL